MKKAIKCLFVRERNMNKVSPSVDTVRPVEAVTAVTEAKKGPLKQKTVFEHEDDVSACSFSPEGLLAVGDTAKKMTVYNLKAGTKEHVFEHEDGSGYVRGLGVGRAVKGFAKELDGE